LIFPDSVRSPESEDASGVEALVADDLIQKPPGIVIELACF
jgi:hypothetical protein